MGNLQRRPLILVLLVVAILATGTVNAQRGTDTTSSNAGLCNPNAPEVCNGVDDNCNNYIDEGLGTISCGVGACQNTVESCFKGVPQQCTPKPAPSTNEICGNGIDDNCNGQVDEGCQPACTSNWVWSSWSACSNGMQTRTASDSNNCPTEIGKPADQTQSCNSPTINTTTTGSGSSTNSSNPTTCIPHQEICGNNIDDNCNGQVDEGCLRYDGQYCQSSSQCYSQNCANGICATYQDCLNSCTTTGQNCVSYSCGWFFNPQTCQKCEPYQYINSACALACHPTCTPVTQPCTVGVGACARPGNQTRLCVNDVLGAPGACSATPGNPIAEICGNNIDDNCNGQVDEGCTNPPPACIPHPEICGNNIDDDCNGQIDDGCLRQNGQSCQVWSQCYSQSCSNGICVSHQDCINACTTTSQNCVNYNCWFGSYFCSQQCTSYQTINQACALSCH